MINYYFSLSLLLFKIIIYLLYNLIIYLRKYFLYFLVVIVSISLDVSLIYAYDDIMHIKILSCSSDVCDL